jgi:3-oxoacyl-[acyl-carrier protein] reductase
MAASIDRALATSGIIANCINPGPVDTGYAEGDVHSRIAGMFPDGRWGSPADIADVVGFLVSDEGAWIRGQVLDVEGGFYRYA